MQEQKINYFTLNIIAHFIMLLKIIGQGSQRHNNELLSSVQNVILQNLKLDLTEDICCKTMGELLHQGDLGMLALLMICL